MFPYKTTFQPVGDTPNVSQPTENQWSNPSTYQNVDLETVNWAALAQQWITMKESCTIPTLVPESHFISMPMAPPPPTISKQIQHDLGEEQGEAPMEVEHDEDEQTPSIDNNNVCVAPPAPQHIFLGNQTNNGTANASTQSNWSNAKTSETKPWHKKGSRRNNSHSGHDSKMYRQPHTFKGDPYNTISPQIYNLKSNESPWQMANSVRAHTPATSHTHTDTPSTHSDANFKSGTQLDNVDLMSSTLDAAQRKTLPAWIREGLEKMERGKQKEADRIREAKERDEKQRQIRLAESKVISLNRAANIEPADAQLLLKSKFESDSDDGSDSDVIGGDRGGGDGSNGNNSAAKKCAVVDVYAISKAGSSKSSAIVSKPHRSKADILQDIMLSVRKNLTEILLEVTNEQINEIATETLSKMRSKGLKAQTVQKNALTAITGGLGLVTYDDSDGSKSDSDSDAESDDSNKSRNDDDSDQELKKLIEERKAAFEIKSAEIEEYLAQNEEKEKNWLERDEESSEKSESTVDSGNGTPSVASGKVQNRSESGEIQQDKNKLTTSSGGRKADRKGSRFSDAKGLVYNVANSMAALNSSAAVGHQSMHFVENNANKDSENSSDSLKKWSHASDSHHSHSSKHERSERDRRSSSISRSRYSRRPNAQEDRSHSRHRHRSRSPSTDRASKSSKTSRSTRDTYSKEKNHNRSRSHRSSKRGRSRSRSRSYDSRSSYHRHR